MAANYDELKGRGFSDKDIEKLPINELIAGMQAWVATAGAIHTASGRASAPLK